MTRPALPLLHRHGRRSALLALPLALVATLGAGPAAALCSLAEDSAALEAIGEDLPVLEGISLRAGEAPVPAHVTAAQLIDRLADRCAEGLPEAACRAGAVAAVSRQAISEIRSTVRRSVPPFPRMVLRATALCLARIEPTIDRDGALSDRMAAATLDAVTAEIEARLAAEGRDRIALETKNAFEKVVEIEPGARVEPFRCAGARFGLKADGFDCAGGPVPGHDSPAILSEKVSIASGELLDQSVSEVGKRLTARAEAESALDPHCPPFDEVTASYRSAEAAGSDWQVIWKNKLCKALEAGGLTETDPADPPADWSFLADWLENAGNTAVSPEAAIAFLEQPARAEARKAALEASIEEERTIAETFRAAVCRLHGLSAEEFTTFDALEAALHAEALDLMKEVPADQCNGQQ